jgi:hypothetical protein
MILKLGRLLAGFFNLSGLLVTPRALGPVMNIVSPDRTMSQPTPEPIFPLLSSFRLKTRANPPIDNINGNEKRDSSLNLESIKI